MTIELRKPGVVDALPPRLGERARQHLIARRRAAIAISRRQAWTAWQISRQLPGTILRLIGWSPRGLARATAAWARYLRDTDTAELRAHHAGSRESTEYERISRARSANLTARWMVNGTLFLAGVAVVLAWTAPHVFGVLLAVLVFCWVVKTIPGRGWWEIAVAAGLALGAYLAAPWVASKVPVPPTWLLTVAGLVAVLVLGWVGRPRETTLVTLPDGGPANPIPPLTAPMVTAALVRLGISGLVDKTAEEIRVFAPGVGRSARGYHISLELPAGVTTSDVMDRREPLAAALRRELGTVWPSQGDRHPGHLNLYVSDLPMATAPQARWAVADGRALDIFNPIEMFTDQEGRWVSLTLAYQQGVIGGAPGYGKTFGERQLGVAAAFDPRVRIVAFDGKGNGDLRPLRLVAHGFYEGDEDDEIAEQLAAVRQIREEMRRRARFLRELPREENPLSKVTSALVDRYPDLAPILLLVDEVQVYTEHDDKDIKKEFIALFTDLVKRGRSAGIIPIFATQKPDASALPSGIADNCSLRLCFRVNTSNANNQVLGNGMYAMGVRATLFSAKDKGLAWLRGDGAEPQVVRTVYGLDAVKAEELMMLARAIRERRGLLSGQAADEEAFVPARDVVADVLEVLREHARDRAHLAELAEWLPARWADYLDADAAEVGKRLRNRGVEVQRAVKVAGRTNSGVRASDLRKQVRPEGPDFSNLEG